MYSEIVSLIRSLYPQKYEIALHEPIFSGRERELVLECIDSTFVSSVGKYVDQFEIKVAEFTGATKAVACVNGTAALHVALYLSGVNHGDEVITQALTFVATANAIRICGAHPIFLDSDPVRLGLSASALREFLEEHSERRADGNCYNKRSGRRIRACVPMHVFGHPVEIEEIKNLCEAYGLVLIEDAAESLGSRVGSVHTGLFGDIGVLSFNGNKTLTTGGGGMLLFRDEAAGRRAKHVTTTAKVPHAWEFFHDELGFNYRMPNLNAALGVAQLEYLADILDEKRKISDVYREFFKDKAVRYVDEPLGSKSNFWLNAVLFPDRKSRDGFLAYANQDKVMVRPPWVLMSDLPHLKYAQHDSLTVARDLEGRLANLPSGCRYLGVRK